MGRIKWRKCKNGHDWVSTTRVGIYQCSRCRASGYTTIRKQPLTGVEKVSEIKPYKCPTCGGCTIVKQRDCPDCLEVKRSMEGSPRAMSLEISSKQRELLLSLKNRGTIEKLEKDEVTAMTCLKRRGLVERVILWRLTEDGKEGVKNFVKGKKD